MHTYKTVNSMAKFLDSLAMGKGFEADAIWELKKRGGELLFTPNGYFKEYDFVMKFPKGVFRFECKYDKYSCKNGDVAIEYLCSKKPSGIASTTAEFWCIRACNDFFIINVIKLKKLILDKAYYRIAKSDRTEMFIFRKDFLIEHATLIKTYGN